MRRYGRGRAIEAPPVFIVTRRGGVIHKGTGLGAGVATLEACNLDDAAEVERYATLGEAEAHGKRQCRRCFVWGKDGIGRGGRRT